MRANPIADELASLRSQPLDSLRRRLTLKPDSELRTLAARLGADDLLSNRLLLHDKGAFRSALIEWVAGDGETGDSDEDDEALDLSLVESWLKSAADPWTASEPLPASVDAMRNDPRWSKEARGYEVRQCLDDPVKGKGVFATRDQPCGSIVGLYYGEELTQREFACRHGWNHGLRVDLSAEERDQLALRRARLDALTPASGRPMPKGALNGGSYALLLLPDMPESARGLPGVVAWIDAEDPNLSSWCRFINHADTAETGCNCELRVDGWRRLVWIETCRDIANGEEILFHYGNDNVLSVKRRRGAKGSTDRALSENACMSAIAPAPPKEAGLAAPAAMVVQPSLAEPAVRADEIPIQVVSADHAQSSGGVASMFSLAAQMATRVFFCGR